ncbi:MAG: hypothetical protein U0359_05515 [Byssovorax sp.]
MKRPLGRAACARLAAAGVAGSRGRLRRCPGPSLAALRRIVRAPVLRAAALQRAGRGRIPGVARDIGVAELGKVVLASAEGFVLGDDDVVRAAPRLDVLRAANGPDVKYGYGTIDASEWLSLLHPYDNAKPVPGADETVLMK